MIAMQYKITLPSDYDMGIIRKRVRDNGHKTDGFPDLKMKAYLIAEKTKYNNFENQYAPFYLWEQMAGMNQFLLGGPFNNIINSFGRPNVYSWIVLHEYVCKTTEQQFAIVQTSPIPSESDFSDLCNTEEKNFHKWMESASTKAYITAYNPLTWEICRFHMTTDLDMLKTKDSLIYNVHHIS